MIRTSIAACVIVLLMLGSCSQAGEDGKDVNGPDPLYVDDFEDGDKDNILGTWVYTNSAGDAVDTFETLAPPPGDGNYALNLHGTVKPDWDIGGGLYMGVSTLNTGSTTVATPVDVSSCEKICFGLYFLGSSSVWESELRVRLSGSDGTVIEYLLLSDSDSDFKDYSLPLSEFTVSNGTLSGLKESVEQILFSIIAKGTSVDSLDYILVIDDVRFE